MDISGIDFITELSTQPTGRVEHSLNVNIFNIKSNFMRFD